MADAEFICRVLAAFDDGGVDRDALWWRTDGEYAPVRFFVNCNDLFWWASADAEDITPENVAELERAAADCIAVDSIVGPSLAGILFCSRVRKMRPQGAYYAHIDRRFWPLFDACGPVREVDFCNPKKQPT